MKNLKNYGVQELNAQEISETEGGYLWFPPNIFSAYNPFANKYGINVA